MGKTCLSVDWDFFTPNAVQVWNNSFIDESLHFLWENWKDWSRLSAKVKPVNANGFWHWLSTWFVLPPKRKVIVSESHVEMDKLLTNKCDTLLLFDSHHDCYYLSSRDEKYGPDCGNWGTLWLRRRNKSGKILWISQLKNKDKEEYLDMMSYDISKNVSAYSLDDIKSKFNAMCKEAGGKIELDFVHICRSGCWAPPWTDGDFLRFLKDSGFNYKVVMRGNDHFWNPTVDRWKYGRLY